ALSRSVRYHCFFIIVVLTSSCRHPCSTLFPYTTLFRSGLRAGGEGREFEHAHRTVPEHGRRIRDDLRVGLGGFGADVESTPAGRSEEHTSELQSRFDLVCRLLLEKKDINTKPDKLVRSD